MTTSSIIKIFKKYNNSSSGAKKRKKYFRSFEEKMIYRTTKTENPQATKIMVRAVLNKFC